MRGVEGLAMESSPRDYTATRENAGWMTPGQTKYSFNLDQVDMTTSRNVPLCTPPAGKAYFISDVYFSHDGSTAVRVALYLADAAGNNPVTIYSAPCKGDTAPIQQAGQETQIDVPAGVTLWLTWAATNGVNLYANLQGFQQNLGAQ